MFKVLKFVNKIPNIFVRNFSKVSSNQNVPDMNFKKFAKYVFTRENIAKLSSIFSVENNLTKSEYHNDEIVIDSTKAQKLINIPNESWSEKIKFITDNIDEYSCDDLILLMIAFDSIGLPPHHEAAHAVTIALSKQIVDCNENKLTLLI